MYANILQIKIFAIYGFNKLQQKRPHDSGP